MALALAEPVTQVSSRPADGPGAAGSTTGRTGERPAGRLADEDALVREHLPLVGHLVRELLSRLPAHVCRDDLVSAGMFALAASARSWEPDRGVPFGRFAAIRIRGALVDELRSRDWASRSVRGKAREVEETRGTLAASLGRSPSSTEVAAALGCAVREVAGVEADVRRAAVLSLQALTADGTGDLVAGGEQPEAMLLHREQIGCLRDAIAELPDRLRTVVLGYFFQQRRMIDIAAELGVTESRVSQLRGEALTLLRDALRFVDDAGAAGQAPARPGNRAGARSAYVTAVASRSTLAGRLAVTTVLGDTHETLGAPLHRPRP